MPNNFDFSKLKNIKEKYVEVIGWTTPLFVEYGMSDCFEVHSIMSYCWRVKDTQHTFVIPVLRMDFLSSGDYKKHFENVLENFREDYIIWKEEGFNTDWGREYQDQYSRFINI